MFGLDVVLAPLLVALAAWPQETRSENVTDMGCNATSVALQVDGAVQLAQLALQHLDDPADADLYDQ